MRILPNISRIKSNQTTKFGQQLAHYKKNVFLQNSWGKWGRETISRLLFVFEKTLYEVKASDQQFSLNLLMPGGNKKVTTHTWTNLQLSAAGLFQYVWPFCYHQALKGWAMNKMCKTIRHPQICFITNQNVGFYETLQKHCFKKLLILG